MLMSPNFLYRWELAPKAAVKEGAFVRFNSYEIASRLSYLLWASMPDDDLFARPRPTSCGPPTRSRPRRGGC